MRVGIVTVGDEVLAGDIANTNARWLAKQLNDRGATVSRILTIPDDRDLIERTVANWSSTFDAVIVTGGLGGTHDDVTADAIAGVFDTDLVVDSSVRTSVVETVAAHRGLDPTSVTAEDLDFDVDAWAALPKGSRVVPNPEGLCPGCVIDNVYVFPGVPEEMQAMFESVASEFNGDLTSTSLYTTQSEGSMVEVLPEVMDRFEVTVGSYPAIGEFNRIKVIGTDQSAVAEAVGWLREELDIVPESKRG